MPHFEEGFRSQGKFLEMILMFNPEGFSLHLASCRPDRRILSGPIDVFPSRHNRQLIQYLDDIAESCHTIKAPELLARCLLSAVLCILIRESHRASSYPQTEHSKVSRARNIISAEFTNAKLTVTQIAEDIQCSADYLSRLFQQETGQTLINYLNNRRIEHAQHLLKNSDLNCAEIAWASGYSSPSYFNRVFVQRLQVTPKVFRSLH
ncbi:MAG: helix-turn-helix transcriptional regulator [Verrucomicrobiota bacterium]